MVHRLMELNIVHLEWWHRTDVIEKFGLKIFHNNNNNNNNNSGGSSSISNGTSNSRSSSSNDDDNTRFFPIFIVERVTLIDYEQIEVSHGKQYPFTSPPPSSSSSSSSV